MKVKPDGVKVAPVLVSAVLKPDNVPCAGALEIDQTMVEPDVGSSTLRYEPMFTAPELLHKLPMLCVAPPGKEGCAYAD